MNKGILYAAGAYIIWGVLPIYWKALSEVSALQILAHRIVWSFVFLTVLISLKREWRPILMTLRSFTRAMRFILAASLLTVNWLTYIWGVNSGFIVETSLGYFINPLVNVLLGVVFLRERLRPMQWLPVSMAGLGVLYLTISYWSLPWIALVLAFSFGIYALVKKTSPLGSLDGLTLETGILLLPALGYLVFAAGLGVGAFGALGWRVDILLVFTGLATALPLLLFGGAARRIDLSTLGLMQYIAPTCQFLIGVLVYGEPFTQARLVGFGVIWLALILFSAEGFLYRRSSTPSIVARQQ